MFSLRSGNLTRAPWLRHISKLSRSRSVSTQQTVRAGFVVHKRLEIPPQTTARIAGRKWLPGSSIPGHKLPEHMASPKDNRPPVYEVVETQVGLDDWSARCREILDDQLHVHGAILFRGLPLRGAECFSSFYKQLGYTSLSYVGGSGANREEIADQVLSVSYNEPSVFTLEPHSEMAYCDHYPRKIFFYCDVPAKPGCGGESGIADVRDVMRRLDPDVLKKFDKLGVKYQSHCDNKNTEKDAYKTWQDTFFTDDVTVAESFLEDNGCEYMWEADESLKFWRYQPAFANHPITGEKVWCNQVNIHDVSYCFNHPFWADKHLPYDRYPFHVYYGDGSEIEPEVLRHIRDVLWQETVGFQLQKGDVLAYDNVYAWHSRLGYDCERRILVSMTVN